MFRGLFANDAIDLEIVKAGLTDGVLHKEPKVDLQTYGPKLQTLQQTRAAVVSAGEKKVGQAFLAKAATEAGATKTASGLVIVTLKAGSGPAPKSSDTVKVHYQGTLTGRTAARRVRGMSHTGVFGRVLRSFF